MKDKKYHVKAIFLMILCAIGRKMYSFSCRPWALGGWHEQAVTQIEELGAALARQTGEEESDKKRPLPVPGSPPSQGKCSFVPEQDPKFSLP